MFAKAWAKAKEQNLYVLAAGLGVFGLVDAITPGPSADHAMGLAIVVIAVYMWVMQ